MRIKELIISVIMCGFMALVSNGQLPAIKEDGTYRWESLVDMCAKYNTDKCEQGHNFIEIYERLISPGRDTMTKFFEIGILNGASHMMWREYFPPKTSIYGIDIKDYSKQSEGSGIKTLVADQSNRKDLEACINEFGGGFDVILDDGGHAMDHQQVSFAYLFKYLKPGGVFIIEDVHTSLPYFYPDPDFKVNETGANSTLTMLEWFVRQHKIKSEYMNQYEIDYLEKHIESVEINYRNTRHHSILAIIRKKK